MGSRNQLKDRVRPFFWGPQIKAKQRHLAAINIQISFYLKMMFGAKLVIFMLILGFSNAHELSKRQATLQLDGNDNNYLASGAILLVIVGAIVLLDFAIFGTYASRSDELNPVSRFFFHARNGLQNIRNRRRNIYADYYHRHQRSVDEFGPVVDALHKAEERYNY